MAEEPAKYMTVPEKIELKAEGGGYQDVSRERYRPMKVPDKITLEPTSSPAIGGDVGESGSSGGNDDIRGGVSHYATNEVRRQGVPEATNIPLSNVQSAPTQQVADHAAEFKVASSGILDLERRVRALEQRVQRLTDTIVNSRPSRANNERGSRFWYVLTFAGWMMVPLVVAYMYQSKRLN